jgi:hypothetical protein
MSGWNANGEIEDENARLADCVFSMLLLERIYVLSHFLDAISAHESQDNALRRWVFLQIMPPFIGREDIFTLILRSIRHGDGDSMLQLARELLETCRKHQLFGSALLYCAVDEAQEGLNFHKKMFRSSSGAHRRPALYALYRFYDQIRFFDGYIFAGTGLSMSKLELITSSVVAKRVEGLRDPVVFTDTVHFTKEVSTVAHHNYISRYLKVTSDDQQSSRLMERILYWFRGRYVHLSQPSLLLY